MPTDEDRSPLAEERAAGGTALLIIDMLSDWRFPHGADLLKSAALIAPRIATLKSRCRQAGVPVVYVNDNRGRWRSDLHAVVDHACAQDGEGGHIAQLLRPREDDYCVLKPKHSGFYATPLELLLRHLHVAQIILTGVSTEQCVATTAMDACIRDFKVWCPHDAVASHRGEAHERTLVLLHETLGVTTEASALLCLPGLGMDKQ